VTGRGQPGQVLAAPPGPLVVACGEQALELLEVQVPGGRRMPARELLHAWRRCPADVVQAAARPGR
jgi:methionyl-tRNA formyltransferase